ncbi:MAG: GTP-binding protein [Bacteroidetes bacterium]|nr:MAG: GTP-binding protein [Bacteroidota bacterium]
MIIRSADFISSNVLAEKCPAPDKPEYAFIGRSNVGKSSLINMLCGKTKLAHVSGRPGKTQVINHFLINGQWYLVDLPGYGFAKVSKEMREKFDKMIRGYLVRRSNLVCVFLLVDSRLEPQMNDIAFMEWLAESQIPFAILFTKCDKSSSNVLNKSIAAYKKTMQESWDEFPMYFLTSAETKKGRDEVLQLVDETNKLWKTEM